MFSSAKFAEFFVYMVRNNIYILIGAIFTGASVFFYHCQSGENKQVPDVSHIDVQVNLQRFDRDLFALDTNQMQEGLSRLSRQYPDFLPFFLTEIAHDQSNPNETPLDAITGFATASQVRRLNDSCQAAFPDLTRLTQELGQLLRYYRYYFPQKPLPRFVTAVTEFVGDAYAVNDTLVMIGLDMFLGENFSGYNPDYFPYYLRRQFQPDYIPIKTALALATRLAGPPPGEQVLDYMIHNGKILYVLDCLLPAVPDSLKMGYTREQMEECFANEQEVWARLLDMNVLYQPLNNKNQKIVMPSPSADNVFQEAPGEIGNWIGWRIVSSYMLRHPGTSLDNLFNLRDTQQFLEQAKYKPKRVN